LSSSIPHLTKQSDIWHFARIYFAALRPHQWIKNALVLVPALAAHQFTLDTFGNSLTALISFSVMASSVYVVNDLVDLTSDRAHPRKRYRPFASNIVPTSHGLVLATGLLMAGLIASCFLGLAFVLVMLGYYLLATAYSLILKRLLIIDICALAGLYTLRILAGGVATHLPLSVWLLAFSVFFFFSLAAIKRQAELVDSAAAGIMTVHGRGYETGDLPVVAAMALSAGYVSVLVMALYVNSPAVLELYSQPHVLLGICLVLLFWISRLVMVTQRGRMDNDPIIYAIKDLVSLGCLVLIVMFAVAGVLL
jgi:4-hydroxybenzoate polyprenyltransferase